MRRGFTLIELSIVLVIVGLIVGGILWGRDLISAAGVRAQISQIEKYQSAVNTFKGKYGHLPGDIPNPVASQYGFIVRGSGGGEGDGNGIIQGSLSGTGFGRGWVIFIGEPSLFWEDLSQAGLVEGLFNTGPATGSSSLGLSGGVELYLPKARIGNGNYVYAWSGGWSDMTGAEGDHTNYFGLSAVMGQPNGTGEMASDVGLTVQQAYAMDAKLDDGLPQTGRVMALYGNWQAFWAAGGNRAAFGQLNWGDHHPLTFAPAQASDYGADMPAGPNSCYDASSGQERYSMGQSGGSNVNCALSFKFQ